MAVAVGPDGQGSVGRFSPTMPKLSYEPEPEPSRAEPPLEKAGTGFESTRPFPRSRAPSLPLLLRPPPTLPTPIAKQRALSHRTSTAAPTSTFTAPLRRSLVGPSHHPRSPATMQYPDDTEDLSATSGDESDQEDEADAHVAGADGDEAKEEEAASDADADVDAGSDADVEADAPAAGSDADGDLDVQEQEDEADVRAAGTDATDADEEVDADPADNRRAKLVVAASLLLAAIVTVTATIYAPPPPVTPSAHRQGTCTSPVGCTSGFGL